MRKLFVFLTVFSIIVSCAMVCFGASGTDGYSNDIVYSTLPFDRFNIFGTDQHVDSAWIPWAYRDYRVKSGSLDSAYQNGALLVEVAQPSYDSQIYGRVTSYFGEAYNPSTGWGVSIVSFYCDEMFLTNNCSLQITFPSPTTQISQVVIDGTYCFIDTEESVFDVPNYDSERFFYDTSDDPNWVNCATVDLGRLLLNYVSSIYEQYVISETAPVYIRNLTINIETVSTGDLPEWTYFDVVSTVRSKESFDGLFEKWCKTNVTRVGSGGNGGSVDYGNDVSGWLTSSVRSFLTMEFAPGFSIDRMLYIAIIVAVVLWFLHVLK